MRLCQLCGGEAEEHECPNCGAPLCAAHVKRGLLSRRRIGDEPRHMLGMIRQQVLEHDIREAIARVGSRRPDKADHLSDALDEMLTLVNEARNARTWAEFERDAALRERDAAQAEAAELRGLLAWVDASQAPECVRARIAALSDTPPEPQG